MTGSPYEILKQATERCHWSDGDKVAILLEYIEQQDSDDAFHDYLAEVVAEEENPMLLRNRLEGLS